MSEERFLEDVVRSLFVMNQPRQCFERQYAYDSLTETVQNFFEKLLCVHSAR